MLQQVFKELYEQGILIFLDNDSYVTNNAELTDYITATDDTELTCLTDRDKFKEIYPEKIEKGWIFCFTKNLETVLTTLKEDTCYLVEYGFNSDTDEKAAKIGRALSTALTLNKFKITSHWNEKTLKDRKVSTVITVEDLPIQTQILVENFDDSSDF